MIATPPLAPGLGLVCPNLALQVPSSVTPLPGWLDPYRTQPIGDPGGKHSRLWRPANLQVHAA